jgi:TP901-1 family phage major tail protein
MARTNAIINGTDLGVYDGGTLIALSTTCTMTLNRDMRDTSNKDSAGWKTGLPGQKSWTISTEGLYNPSSTKGMITLFNAWTLGTVLTITVKEAGTPGTQDYYWSGTAYVTSLSANAPNEGNVTFSCTLQGTGAWAMTDPLAV